MAFSISSSLLRAAVMAPMELGQQVQQQEQEELLRLYCVLAARPLAAAPGVVVAGVAESESAE